MTYRNKYTYNVGITIYESCFQIDLDNLGIRLF